MDTLLKQSTGTNLHHDAEARLTPVHFDEHHVLHELKHYLPSQTPIKDFIHHNTLHAYQHMKFYDALFKAGKIFGYQVTLELKDFRQLHLNGRIKNEVLERVIARQKGTDDLSHWMHNLVAKNYDTHNEPRIGRLRAHWKTAYQLDIDNLVQPLLFRVLGSYLDQGIATWKFPVHEDGFLASIRQLEMDGASFFRSKAVKSLLSEEKIEMIPLLRRLVGNEAYFEQYLFDQQFSHPGWSGIVAAIEDAPHTLLDRRKISLHDLVLFELLLELDVLYTHRGQYWQPLAEKIDSPPIHLFAAVPSTELQQVLRLWQDAFEWSYYDEVMNGMLLKRPGLDEKKAVASFQAIFCIDERECSIRRHIEYTDPNCETLGSPGFFGAEFYFQPQNGKFYEKLCPAPVTPNYLIKEFNVKEPRGHELLYTSKAHNLITGTLSSLTLGFWAGLRLLQNLFRPKMSPAISNAFSHMHQHGELTVENTDLGHRENGLQVGYTVEEMAARVEGLLRGIGLVKNFAAIVYAVAHGSSSANNPHHSAHDCGACSGRPGSVNARVFAHMANHPQVRLLLAARGIDIPPTTQFVGALHDTAADQVAFYDVQRLDHNNQQSHQQNVRVFERALDLNAKERSRRFASINTKASLKNVRKAIRDRSASMFEPRPELGHGTNTLCIVGRRELTKDLFLDRRAFLNSYDYRTDPDGKVLMGVMRPIGLVCGGINLEYYFSRVDNYKLGAGTKLPHNVMGLIGVANSSDGDLRPGLPLQMIEVHDPVRLMVVVEHYPDKVLQAIQTTPEIYEWYINEWVHVVALHPDTHQFYYFKDGVFTLYEPVSHKVGGLKDFINFVESANEMRTNHIVDATRENLPVYTLNH